MKNLAVALLSLLFMTACNLRPDPRAEATARENDTTLVNPPGRYQMLPAGSFVTGEPQVVILDTRYGRITRCTVRAGGVDCVMPKPAFP